MKRILSFTLALLMLLALGCSTSGNTREGEEDVFDQLMSNDVSDPKKGKPTAPATNESEDDEDECPTNYWYGGKVAHASNGYTYFTQYDVSDNANPQIVIARMKDESEKVEIIHSEPAFRSDYPRELIRPYDDTQGEYYIDYEKAGSWGYDPVIVYRALTAYGDRLYFIRVSSNISSLCRIDLRGNHSDVIKTFDGRSYDGFFGDISNVMRYGKYLFFRNGEKLDMENEQMTPIFSDYMLSDDNYDIHRVLVGVEANHLYYLEYKGDVFAGLFRRPVDGGDAEAVPIKTSKVLPEDVLTAVAIRRGYGCICNGMLWICVIDEDEPISPITYLGKIELATGEPTCVYAPAFDVKWAFEPTGGISIARDGIYCFDREDCLHRRDLNGERDEILTKRNAVLDFRKNGVAIAGNRVWYLMIQEDVTSQGIGFGGFFAVSKGATTFVPLNVMGEDASEWDLENFAGSHYVTMLHITI